MIFMFKIDFAYLCFIQASQVKWASAKIMLQTSDTVKNSHSPQSCTVQESEITNCEKLSAVKSSQDTFKFCGSKKVL